MDIATAVRTLKHSLHRLPKDQDETHVIDLWADMMAMDNLLFTYDTYKELDTLCNEINSKHLRDVRGSILADLISK